jgi:6-pyruvoyl-tetrahydropterin synthase related domain
MRGGLWQTMQASTRDTTPATTHMRGLLRFVFVVLIGIAGAQPLLNERLPRGADALLHLYRIVALDELVRGGVLFSRWLPNLAFGYGYPIFQYYPPLPHYTGVLFTLAGLAPVTALSVTFVFAGCLAACGMYLWARDIVAEHWAFAAAAAYAFAPYTLYNIGERMALAEYAALAWAPLLFWSVQRCVAGSVKRHTPVLVLSYAGVLLSHNITAMLITPAALAYALVLAITRGPAGWRAALRPAPGFAIGLGLSAFFWLPAFAERALSRLDAALGAAYDFRNYFVGPAALFAWPHPVDPSLLNSQAQPGVSWLALGLALIAVIAGLLGRPAWRAHALYCAVGASLALFMTSAHSAPIWDALPLLRYVLYPSRWLGPAALFVALLSAMGLAAMSAQLSQRLAVAISMGFIALSAGYGAFWQLPSRHSIDLQQHAAAIPAVERALGIIGTTSIGEYAPVAVQRWPERDADANARFDALSTPGVNVRNARYAPLEFSATIRADQASTLTIAQFYFPGWRATIDSLDAPLSAADQSGLMQLAMPAGEHKVRVWFASTPLRDAATALSVASAMAALISMGIALRAAQPAIRSESRAHAGTLITGIVLMLALLGTKTWGIDTTTNVWRQPGGHSDEPAQAIFGDALALLQSSRADYHSDSNSVELNLFWRASAPPGGDYSINVQIIDGVGELITQTDREHPDGAYPTSQWLAGTTVRDSYILRLPGGTPPGQYSLRVALYRHGDAAARLAVQGQRDPYVTAGVVTTSRPDAPVAAADLAASISVSQTIAPGVLLNGAALPLDRIRVGEYFPLTLVWSLPARIAAGADGHVCFAARARASATVTELGCQALIRGFALSQWRAGDIWKVPYRVKLPPQLLSGEYDWLVHSSGADQPIMLGQINIDAPARVTTAPMPAHAQSATFADAGALIGYDVPAEITRGEVLSVTLYWRATAVTDAKYTVYVHLLNAQGERRAGHDGAPDDGMQPTSTWLPGVFITDMHRIDVPPDLPAGAYRLVVGMYDTYTGEAMLLTDGRRNAMLETSVTVRE